MALYPGSLFPKTQLHSNQEKSIRQIQLRDAPQNNQPVLLIIVNIMKNKESLRNCQNKKSLRKHDD